MLFLNLVSVRWPKSVCRVLLDFFVVVSGDLKSLLQLDLSASPKGYRTVDWIWCTVVVSEVVRQVIRHVGVLTS